MTEQTTADAVEYIKGWYGDTATLLAVEPQTVAVERLQFQLSVASGSATLVVLREVGSGDLTSGFVCPCCDRTQPCPHPTGIPARP